MKFGGAAHELFRAAAAFAIAPLLPILLYIRYTGQPLPFVALFVAYVLALGVGVPTYLVMRQLGATRLRHFLLFGFLAFGALAFLAAVGSYSVTTSLAVGDVKLVSGGRLLAAGWLRCAYYGVTVGVAAALGGAVFWAMVHSGTVRRHGVAVALPAGALLAVANVLALRSIDWAGPDRAELGCFSHVAGRPIHPSIDLQIANSEWPELAALFEQAAKDSGLAFTNLSETRPGEVMTLALGMCADTEFSIITNEIRWARYNYAGQSPGYGVSVVVYVVENNGDWQPPARRLLRLLEERWGDKVLFRGESGEVVPKPADLFGQEQTPPQSESEN